MDCLTLAGSWAVAKEVVRAVPGLRVFETHPGGGQFDCLSLLGQGVHVDINRAGSIHVHDSPAGERSPLIQDWQRDLTSSEGARGLAARIVAGCGLPWPSPLPSTTPVTLTCRVVARLLASRLFDPARWDVRSQFADSSGADGSGIVGEVPTADMAAIPANQLWRVLRDDAVVAWLWDGWAWTAGGDRVDLMSAYRRGRRIDDLVALVTAPPTPQAAPPLPALPRLPPQPIGEWP